MILKIGNIEVENALLLAPMEDVTDLAFRLVCKELGADIVYTEFVNSEGLIRNNLKTKKKLKLSIAERPAGIQIYGASIKSMVEAAKIAEEENPDIIDINAGCWVKNVVGCGAGAGLLKDPAYMQQMTSEIVKSVNKPVTVKTRLGIDSSSINILEVAKRMEDSGIQALTLHCRTRVQGHKGDADWEWINKVKEVINIPVILNGNILTCNDGISAFTETNANGIMIARGAIGRPWIFGEIKAKLAGKEYPDTESPEFRIKVCLRHLYLSIELKGETKSVLEHRKHYSGYLKGFANSSSVRVKLMKVLTYKEVEELLFEYLNELNRMNHEHRYFSAEYDTVTLK